MLCQALTGWQDGQSKDKYNLMYLHNLSKVAESFQNLGIEKQEEGFFQVCRQLRTRLSPFKYSPLLEGRHRDTLNSCLHYKPPLWLGITYRMTLADK